MHHLIVNPTAGRGFTLKAKAQVEAFFAEHGLPLTVHQTARRTHATEIARSLPDDARVISFGGDGTMHEVALACLNTQRVLGVIPGGTGDDFAMALGIDHHDVKAACETILRGKTKRVDTALVNGQPFFNALGIGFDADVAHTVLRAPGIFKERNAYLYAIFATLSRLRTVMVEVHADGELFYWDRALIVSMQNGPRTGGNFLFCPEAKQDDGWLDLVVAGRLGRLGLMALLPKVIKGTHLDHPQVFYTRARHIKVAWEEARVAHMEGELVPASRNFDIQLCPASLEVFAP